MSIRDAGLGCDPNAAGLLSKPSRMPMSEGQEAKGKLRLKVTPFRFRDPRSVPPREWIYGRHLARRYVSSTIAPGAVGKSSLTMTDAMAMASGRALVHDKPFGPLRVWLWNGEDDQTELERRMIAIMLHYGLTADDIGDRLFLDNGREQVIRIAEAVKCGIEVATPMVDALEAAIRENRLDAVIIDPFVSVHSLPENDNGAMDLIVKTFARIADRTGCAIELVHHTRKLNGTDADIDSMRGGSSIAGAVRAARALNPMSAEAAKGFGIDEAARRSFVRIDDAKANLAPASTATWFRIVSVDLGNETRERPSDHVGVPQPWVPPDAFDGVTVADLIAVQREIDGKGHRENSQAAEWVGHAIGRVLDFDTGSGEGKERAKKLLKGWLRNSALNELLPVSWTPR